jgi:small subunit ribosomal protein S20
MRQTATRRTTNRARKSMIRTFTRKIENAVAEKDVTEAEASFQVLQKKLDKAAKGSTIHPNKAARRKSRMQKQINAMKAAKG